jgi:hypothetical protein
VFLRINRKRSDEVKCVYKKCVFFSSLLQKSTQKERKKNASEQRW